MNDAPNTPTVHWRADASPYSPRFDDVYRSHGQGLEQARQVFLRGCGLLPEGEAVPLWAQQAQWQVLETGFGLGLNFLATWQAWQTWRAQQFESGAAQQPQRLFFTSVEAWPVTAADIRRSAQPWPELAPLCQALCAQWHGLLPGLHRLEFDGGQVQLRLLIGDAARLLPSLDTAPDSVFLDGFAPQRNPAMWDQTLLQALARLCRPGTRLATWCVAAAVRKGLERVGFEVHRMPGLAPKRQRLQAVFAPAASAAVTQSP